MKQRKSGIVEQRWKIVERLVKLWCQCPTLRLGQLLADVARDEGCWDANEYADRWLINAEDEELSWLLVKFVMDACRR